MQSIGCTLCIYTIRCIPELRAKRQEWQREVDCRHTFITDVPVSGTSVIVLKDNVAALAMSTHALH